MVNLCVNKIVIIIFLSVMFNFSSPGVNLTDLRPKHFIEYSQEVNKREKDEEIIKKKVILYCKLLELQAQVAVKNKSYIINSG